MIALTLSLVLAAAPGSITVAAPNLSGTGIAAETAGYYTEYLAQRMLVRGVRVLTAKEIAIALGIERQRQLLGCAENVSCLAEIGDALNADGTMIGTLAHIGGGYHLDVRVMSRDGAALALFSGQADGEPELLVMFQKAADGLATGLAKRLGKPLNPTASTTTFASAPAPRPAWVWAAPAATGAAVLIGSAVLLGLANSENAGLISGKPQTYADGQAAVSRGSTEQTVGDIGLVVGVAAIAVGGALYWTGRAPPAKVSLQVSPAGAGANVEVRW